jgi:hypothetical protein
MEWGKIVGTAIIFLKKYTEEKKKIIYRAHQKCLL